MPKAESIPEITARNEKLFLDSEVASVTTLCHSVASRAAAKDLTRQTMARVLADAFEVLCSMEDGELMKPDGFGELTKRDRFMIDLEADLDAIKLDGRDVCPVSKDNLCECGIYCPRNTHC